MQRRCNCCKGQHAGQFALGTASIAGAHIMLQRKLTSASCASEQSHCADKEDGIGTCVEIVMSFAAVLHVKPAGLEPSIGTSTWASGKVMFWFY